MNKKQLIAKLSQLGIQLRVEEGNLRINAPKGVLTAEILEEIKANKSYLTAMLSSKNAISKAVEKDHYDLTPTQYFMWFTHEYLDGGKAYTIAATLHLKGNLNTTVLEDSLQKIVNKHESLRTVFRKDKSGNIQQHILHPSVATVAMNIQKHDVFEKETLHPAIEKLHDKRFNLAEELPISASLITNSKTEHILVVLLHHIVSDGWSLQLLSKEVIKTYNTLISGKEIAESTLPIQYKDYSEWLNAQLKTSAYDEKLHYWKTQFKTYSPPLQIAVKKRPGIKTYNGNTIDYTFNETVFSKIKEFIQQGQMTLFTALFGGLTGLFYKYSGQNDITLGTTVAGREHQDLENQIGLYSNALAIRSRFDEEISFSSLMQLQKETIVEAFKNKEYPFTKLIEELKVPKNPARSPLFDVMVLLQNHRNLEINDQKGFNELTADEYKGINRNVSQLDLSFVFYETENELKLTVEYNTDIYDQVFVERLLQHFEQFLSNGITDSAQKINEISILTEKERQQILTEFNSPLQPLSDSELFFTALAQQTAENPEYIALLDNTHTISYQAMENYSNQLANYLVNRYNSKAGTNIGIELPRESWTIITILAVLKLGATFVPIDPSYPEKRKKFIIDDADCELVITESLLTTIQKELHKEATSFQSQLNPDATAYIIYTSGSTGTPKGVPITYAAMSDYVQTFAGYFNLKATDVIVQQASISFDTSIEEIFPILSKGGKLIFHEDKSDFDTLFKLCEQCKVSILSTNPYVLNYLNKYQSKYKLNNLRILISGGDKLEFSDIDQLYKRKKVYNTYGPTETTVCATYHQIIQEETTIPIGKPIRNKQVLILNTGGIDLTPIGIKGEICITGEGISTGYRNRPKLTASKFIQHPFQKGKKLYRTGDIGYWLPDGSVVFAGRNDSQVKIRGYRIELGEIEAAISQYRGVTGVVVLPKRENDEKFLAAYITGNTLEISALKNNLSQQLPEYMIPQEFLLLDTFPITINGKIDKKKLLEFDTQKVKTSVYKAPKTALEKELAANWENLLNTQKIGVEDNFFELGGHSLKAVRFLNSLEEKGYQLSIKELFQNPTIVGIVPFLKSVEKIQIPKAPEMDKYPITASQRRIWTLSQFEGGNTAYNINSSLKVLGEFNKELFKKSVKAVVQKHESLRTCFIANSAGIYQKILSAIAIEDILKFHTVAETSEIAAIVSQFSNHSFNLTKAPLLKIHVIRVHHNEHIILINLHHIVGDGWSVEVLFKEVVENYNKLKAGETIVDEKLNFQFKDYAYYLEKNETVSLEAAQNYWHTQLSGEIPVLEIPLAYNRPEIKTYNGSRITHQFSSEFTKAIHKVTQKNDATLFMGLMAAVNGLLYRYTQETDIVIGTPVAGRHITVVENQIGLFLNTLAIRTRFDDYNTFEELVRKQKQVLLEAYEHQDYPFDKLLEELSIKRNTSRSALFDVMVVLHNQHDLYAKREGFSGTEILPFSDYNNESSQFDMTFSFVETSNNITVSLSYNTDIYSYDVIYTMISYLEKFVIEAVNNPTFSIAKVNYLPESERALLLQQNHIENSEDAATIVDLFNEQTAKTPNAIALISGETTVTYSELHEKSNQLANYLINEKNIQSGDFVGIKLERNEWLLITILAILKSGAVYVPIDIAYPEERIQYIINDSACVLNITQKEITAFLESKIQNATMPEVSIALSNTAYIIYTSGSTGKPKGVQISHANLMALISWSQKEFEATDIEVMYAVTSHCFDLSVYEMFYPLSIGKKIRILHSAIDISTYIEKDKKILLNTVPSVVENLLERKISLANVAAINMAGEPIPITVSNQLVNLPIELRNLYGPSEDTTYSSCYRIEKQHHSSIPIGKPISGTKFYILSEERSLQGRGLIGEIAITGKGLSKGYLNKEKLTQEKFINNPFVKGEKMYLTGDLGYWMPDGNIGFIGRKDHQVKLRGYRIELEEIAYALQKIDAVQQAVVLVKEEVQEKYIAAYLTGEMIDIPSVKNALSKKLPAFMIPAHFQILDEIPRTPNGKTDTKALQNMTIKKVRQDNYKAPETTIEKELVDIWQQILKIEKIGVLDDFFEIGGHSLHITRMLYEINEKYDIQVAMKNVFIAKNIEDLAKIIEEERTFNQGFSSNTEKETTNETEIWEI